MQKHVKVYLDYFNSNICEVCWDIAVDIHHILPKSKFWKKTKHLQDDISNLIGLCRKCHKKAHLQMEPYLKKWELQIIHNEYLWKKIT